MTKPTVFFSHSSADKRSLGKLKDLFVAKTGGSIDVFLSSDGQSIPFGRNWVHQVEQALRGAKLMFVFVTPQSLRSSWLHFESGFAYSKDIQVIPVGLGVDLTSVGAPLSLLQGFNIESEAGLNNLIAVVNDTFGHSHAESFTADDLRLISANSAFATTNTLGPHTAVIQEILVVLSKGVLGGFEPISVLEEMTVFLVERGIEHTVNGGTVRIQGMTLHATSDALGLREIRINLDPAVIDVAIPLLDELTGLVIPSGMTKVPIRFDFIEGVEAIEKQHTLTGKLFGSEVRLLGAEHLAFKSLDFSVAHLFYFGASTSRKGSAYVSVGSQDKSVALGDVRALMDILFERGVLYFSDER